MASSPGTAALIDAASLPTKRSDFIKDTGKYIQPIDPLHQPALLPWLDTGHGAVAAPLLPPSALAL